MSIETDIGRIANALEAIAHYMQAPPAPKAEAPAPKPKAEKKAPPAPEPEAAAEAPQDEAPQDEAPQDEAPQDEAPQDEAPAPEAAAAPTLEELGKLVTGILGADASKRPAVVKLLGQYGAKKVPEVPEDQRAAFKAGLEAIGGS